MCVRAFACMCVCVSIHIVSVKIFPESAIIIQDHASLVSSNTETSGISRSAVSLFSVRDQ